MDRILILLKMKKDLLIILQCKKIIKIHAKLLHALNIYFIIYFLLIFFCKNHLNT